MTAVPHMILKSRHVHILSLLYIIISKTSAIVVGMVDSARMANGPLLVKALPYNGISRGAAANVTKARNAEIPPMRRRMPMRVLLNCLLSLILDKMGNMIWHMAVGMNWMTIFHWSAASKTPRSP